MAMIDSPATTTYTDTTPPCLHCGGHVVPDILRPATPRQPNRIGAPVRPRITLTTWKCTTCGCIQPRIE